MAKDQESTIATFNPKILTSSAAAPNAGTALSSYDSSINDDFVPSRYEPPIDPPPNIYKPKTSLIDAIVDYKYHYIEKENIKRLIRRASKEEINSCCSGNPVLIIAIEHLQSTYITFDEYYEMIKLIVNHPDIDINKKNHAGLTALMYSVVYLSSENNKVYYIISLLLKHPKIDVNILSKDQKTALMLAFILDNQDAIRILFPYIKDTSRNTTKP